MLDEEIGEEGDCGVGGGGERAVKEGDLGEIRSEPFAVEVDEAGSGVFG